MAKDTKQGRKRAKAREELLKRQKLDPAERRAEEAQRRFALRRAR
jgi:hypothetical protein